MINNTQLSFIQLSYLTFESVLQIVIISVAGFWCAYSGLLPKEGQKIVSLLNVDFFTPCLIFSQLAKTLSLAKIVEISIIPIFYAISTGFSFISGKMMSKIFNLNIDESNFVMANCIFGNSNSLPVSLTLSLAYMLPGLAWDEIPNDNVENIASRGILYLLIFQQIGQVLRWSWGYNKLMRWSRENENGNNLLRDEESLNRLESENSNQLYNFIGRGDITYTSLEKIRNRITLWMKQIRSFMNPPLYSMLISVIVASIHPIQHAIFYDTGFIHNTFGKSVTQLGAVSIPLILIVLGSNLYSSNDTSQKTPNYNKIIFASVVGRMVIPSFFLLPLIALCVKFVKLSILDDPIFLVVGFLLTVSPPAIQLTQITQLNEFFESEMAGVLFWSYVVFALPVSIIIVSAAMSVLKWAD